MGAIADLWKSERGLVAMLLIVAGTVGLALGRLTTEQWIEFTQWLFVTYATGKTITGTVAILKGSGDPAAPAGTPAPVPAPTPSPFHLGSTSALLMVCLMGFGVTSSGCSSNQRHDSLRGAITAVNAARDGFTTWDAQHQAKIVEAATTRTEAETSISAYYTVRQPVLDGFELAYRLIALAATQIDDLSLKAALKQASAIVVLVERMTLPEAPPLRREARSPTAPPLFIGKPTNRAMTADPSLGPAMMTCTNRPRLCEEREVI